MNAPPPKRGRWLRTSVAATLLALLAGRWLADNTADRLWAQSVGVAQAHAGIAELRLTLLALAFGVASLWCVGNVYLFYRSIGSVHVPRRVGNIEFLEAVPRRYLLAGAVVVGVVLAIVVSHDAGSWWSVETLLDEGSTVGARDPVLGRDVGYYLFALPWYRTLHGFATLLTGTMLAVITLLYAGVGAIRWTRRRLHVSELARMHLAGLFATFALALFWGYQLEPAEFVAGIHHVPIDATLVDVRIPVAHLLEALALLAAGVSFAWLWFPSVGVMAGAWTLLAVVSLVGHHLLPVFSASVREGERITLPEVDRVTGELERLAFGLDRHDSTMAPPGPHDTRALAAHRAELRGATVWDAFQVIAALNALPDAEEHVRFLDATLGIYRGKQGQPVPAYLAAREVDLAHARDAGTASWERVHTIPYGHASGFVAVAAGLVADDGGLEYFASLEPADSATPRRTDVRQADREIFFSPAAGEFAIVAGAPGQFMGVPAGGLPQRIALAWALQSPRLVTSDLLGPDVLILWDRQVASRLARYAPFAEFGAPYAVFAHGRLYWMASGYVTAEAFPLSRAVRWRGRSVRYLRAGLIGLVDARSGATSVYLSPAADPLSSAWARHAPEIVRPFNQLAADLASHFRYPEELFEVQVALMRGPSFSPASLTNPAARSARPVTDQARRDRPVWWTGPWARDTSTRLRILARFDNDESTTLTGVVHGTVKAGAPSLEIVRFSPAVELIGPAEVAKRLAEVRAPAVGVSGPHRVIMLADGVLVMQSTYATADGPPRLADVVFQWGSIVARGSTTAAALENALAYPEEGGIGADWSSARQWFDRMEAARQRGDWAAFGRAYDALRRMLSGR